jgi:hypothetical protein
MEDTLAGRLTLESVEHPVHPGEHHMEATLARHLSRIFARAIYLCPQ